MTIPTHLMQSPGLNDLWLDQQLGLGTPGADAAGAAGAATPTVYLTPDALMTYIATRLGNLDGQINDLMNKQQTTVKEQSALTQIQSTLAALQAENDKNNNGGARDPANIGNLENQIAQLVSQMQADDPGNPAIGQLETLHDTIMATGTGPNSGGGALLGIHATVSHGYYSGSSAGSALPNGTTPPDSAPNKDQDGCLGGDEMSGFHDTLSGISNSLNSGAELNMIQLQSLASQRTTAIQLATNLLQSINDGTSKIVANVGH